MPHLIILTLLRAKNMPECVCTIQVHGRRFFIYDMSFQLALSRFKLAPPFNLEP